jgi:hypothetical protein
MRKNRAEFLRVFEQKNAFLILSFGDDLICYNSLRAAREIRYNTKSISQ